MTQPHRRTYTVHAQTSLSARALVYATARASDPRWALEALQSCRRSPWAVAQPVVKQSRDGDSAIAFWDRRVTLTNGDVVKVALRAELAARCGPEELQRQIDAAIDSSPPDAAYVTSYDGTHGHFPICAANGQVVSVTVRNC